MWGEQAVGKLAKGDDPLKPRVVAFVDDIAGPEVQQKVERRLQHFIDRKIAALFDGYKDKESGKDEIGLEGLEQLRFLENNCSTSSRLYEWQQRTFS